MTTMNANYSLSAEMLASSMMLVSISETSETSNGYQSSLSSSNSLRGWGNRASRQTYSTDLAGLVNQEASCKSQFSSSAPSDESWGFFADGPSF